MAQGRKVAKELVTQKEFARRRRVTPQYINKLVRDQVIRLKDGKVDPAQADAAIKAKRNPLHPSKLDHHGPAPRARGVATGELTKNRAENEKYKALTAKAEYEKMIGALLPAAQVIEAQRRSNQNIRTDLLRLPRAAAVSLAQKPAAEVEVELTRWVRDLLSKWTGPALLEEQSSVVGRPSSVGGCRRLQGSLQSSVFSRQFLP
jgi:hypothetical protein